MKLEIGKSYLVYTNEDYYENIQILVLGWISKEEANNYPSYVENLAINEKILNDRIEDVNYLDTLVYYKCKVITTTQKVTANDIVILWDDIIDTTRTVRLDDIYTYSMNIKFKNPSSGNNITMNTLLETLGNTIESYGTTNNVAISYEFKEMISYDQMITENKLIATEDLLTQAEESLTTIIDMKTTAEKITNTFIDNDINSKVNTLSDSIDTINSNINTILSNLR